MTQELKDQLIELIDALLRPGGIQVIRRPEFGFRDKLISARTAIDATTADPTIPAIGDVRAGVAFGVGGALIGDLVLPDAENVLPVNYGYEGEFTGTAILPDASDVEAGVQYGNPNSIVTGTFVVPAPSDVVDQVGYGANGTEFTGTHGV